MISSKYLLSLNSKSILASTKWHVTVVAGEEVVTVEVAVGDVVEAEADTLDPTLLLWVVGVVGRLVIIDTDDFYWIRGTPWNHRHYKRKLLT